MDIHTVEQPESADTVMRAEEYLTERKKAFRRTFTTGPESMIVLKTLARFCRAHESTFDPNSAIANRLDGRREVWLFIQQHLQLAEDELWRLFIPRQKG